MAHREGCRPSFSICCLYWRLMLWHVELYFGLASSPYFLPPIDIRRTFIGWVLECWLLWWKLEAHWVL